MKYNLLKLKKPFELFINPYIQNNTQNLRIEKNDFFYSTVYLYPSQKLNNHFLSIPFSDFEPNTRKNFFLEYNIEKIDEEKRKIYTKLKSIKPLYSILNNFKFLFNTSLLIKRKNLTIDLKVTLHKKLQRKCSRPIIKQIRKAVTDLVLISPEFESCESILEKILEGFSFKNLLKDHPYFDFIKSIIIIQVQS